jgi:hypothetical protein
MSLLAITVNMESNYLKRMVDFFAVAELTISNKIISFQTRDAWDGNRAYTLRSVSRLSTNPYDYSWLMQRLDKARKSMSPIELLMRGDWFRPSVNVEPAHISCGVRQLFNLSTDGFRMVADICYREMPELTIVGYVPTDEQARNNIKTFYIFSDNVGRGAGKYVADFIKANGLGTVYDSPQRQNYNYDDPKHLIQVWIWETDALKMRDMAVEFFKKLDEPVKDWVVPVS